MLTKAGELEAELKAAIDGSPLDEQPHYEAVNDFLIDAYERSWRDA